LSQKRLSKIFLWAGNSILASCPYLFLNSVAIANCAIPEIPQKINDYIEINPHLQVRKNSGRWIALDKVISIKDLKTAYGCLSEDMLRVYQKKKLEIPFKYRNWKRVNKVAFYAPANDFGWVNVFVNRKAEKYSLNKYTSEFDVGSIIVKEGYTFDISGRADIGQLFYMEKMKNGFNAGGNNWKYTEINADGSYAETGGHNTDLTKRCIECHDRRKDTDFLYFLKKK